MCLCISACITHADLSEQQRVHACVRACVHACRAVSFRPRATAARLPACLLRVSYCTTRAERGLKSDRACSVEVSGGDLLLGPGRGPARRGGVAAGRAYKEETDWCMCTYTHPPMCTRLYAAACTSARVGAHGCTWREKVPRAGKRASAPLEVPRGTAVSRIRPCIGGVHLLRAIAIA